MWKKILKWLGFRPKRKIDGELCPWSREDDKRVCRYAQRVRVKGERNSTGKVDCVASLEQLIECILNGPDDRQAIEDALRQQNLLIIFESNN